MCQGQGMCWVDCWDMIWQWLVPADNPIFGDGTFVIMGLELVGITLLMMCLVVGWMSLLLWRCCGLLLSGMILAVLVSFIIHMPFLVHFLPLSIIRRKCFTWQSIFVNFTSHPALHSFKDDISEFDANPGMMCPSLSLVGICGSFSVHVWFYDTHVPSGSLTLSGILAGVIFFIGSVVTRKWLVAPESRFCPIFYWFHVDVHSQ